MVKESPSKKENRSDASGATSHVAAHTANVSSINLQRATDVSKECMDSFLAKAQRSRNMDYGKAKGFIFEEIEGAKLERNMAEAGVQAPDVHVVTDTPIDRGGAGNPHDPSDFRIVRGGETVSQGQAKYYDNPTDATRALLDPKYSDDQFVVPKDQVDDIRANIQKRFDQGNISKSDYDRAMKNIDTASDGFTDTETGISSGGTTTKEVGQMRGKDGKVSQRGAQRYADRFNLKAGLKEVGHSAAAGAVTGAAIAGVTTLVKGSVEALMTDGDFEEVLEEAAVASSKAAVRGAGTAALGATIRYIGTQAGSEFFKNASYSMAVAGGAIELSGSLIDFVNGRIDAQTFAYSACRACTSSIASGIIGNYIISAGKLGKKAFETTVVKKVALPLGTIATLATIASCAFDILKNEHLREVEAQRIEAMYVEAARQIRSMHDMIKAVFEQYKLERAMQFCQFFYGMTAALNECGIESYNDIMYSIKTLAENLDIELKHSEYDDFCAMMTRKTIMNNE